MRPLPVVLVMLMVTMLVRVAPASAAIVTRVDQQQTVYNGALTVRSGAAQTFTAGRTGRLARLDVVLCSVTRGSTVRVRVDLSTAGPAAAATLTLGRNAESCLWYTVLLPHPPMVRIGQVWRLSLAQGKGRAPLWGADMSNGDAYRRGMGTWVGHAVNDFAFRTYTMG